MLFHAQLASPIIPLQVLCNASLILIIVLHQTVYIVLQLVKPSVPNVYQPIFSSMPHAFLNAQMLPTHQMGNATIAQLIVLIAILEGAPAVVVDTFYIKEFV